MMYSTQPFLLLLLVFLHKFSGGSGFFFKRWFLLCSRVVLFQLSLKFETKKEVFNLYNLFSSLSNLVFFLLITVISVSLCDCSIAVSSINESQSDCFIRVFQFWQLLHNFKGGLDWKYPYLPLKLLFIRCCCCSHRSGTRWHMCWRWYSILVESL